MLPLSAPAPSSGSSSGLTPTTSPLSVDAFDDSSSTDAYTVLQCPHPKAAALRGEAATLASLCSFVTLVTPISVGPTGRPIAEGWEWEVRFNAPPTSPYAGANFALQIRFDEEWPASAPFLRFKSVIYHGQVDDNGVPTPMFYRGLPGMYMAHVVLRAYELLEGPLPESYGVEAAMQIISEHDPECTCGRIPALPAFQSMTPLEQTSALWSVSKFIEGHQRRAFESSAQFQKEIISIVRDYTPLRVHPELFDESSGWRPEWFAPSFLAALAANTPDAWASILKEEFTGIFSFDIFTPAFCGMLVDEMRSFEASPLEKLRPNSMNNYGLILNAIGLEGMMDQLLAKFLRPLCGLLFPLEYGGSVDSHHTFLVQYKTDADLSLDMHIDDSEVTLNVNIFDKFEGAGLAFCGRLEETTHRKHTLTYQHRLGADEIRVGERINLIMWCRSSTYRLRRKEEDMHRHDLRTEPDQKCLSRKHDPDFDKWQAYFTEGDPSAVAAAAYAGK